jgi:crotonobetainyl-CoA:carnitine CoA-transferase CaiB-like acyl-CoA transferase
MRDLPGHDINFQALAGALAPRDGADPSVPRLPVADLEGGTVCALLICAAWARRLSRGVGERIDVAMADVVAWWVGPHTGTAHTTVEERSAGSPGYGVFRTRDGEWIALGVLGEARLWAAICTALELDALAELSFEARAEQIEEIDVALTAAIGALDRDVALDRLYAARAPATPVLRPEETTADPQIRSRDFHVESDTGLVAGLPARLASGGRSLATRVPGIDEHPEGFTPFSAC